MRWLPVVSVAAGVALAPAALGLTGPAPPTVLLEESGTGPPESRPSGTYLVQPGDNLWKIAAAHVRAYSQEIQTSIEIGPYWRRLVEENRIRIVSGNPDLIYPGEELVLPPLSTEVSPEGS